MSATISRRHSLLRLRQAAGTELEEPSPSLLAVRPVPAQRLKRPAYSVRAGPSRNVFARSISHAFPRFFLAAALAGCKPGPCAPRKSICGRRPMTARL